MDPRLYLIAVAVGGVAGMWLHEGSHYLVGWIGNSRPEIESQYGLPYRVRHQNLETMDAAIIRMSGISVFAWIPSLFIALGVAVTVPSPVTVFVATANAVVVIAATESDAVAARDPEKFRQMVMKDEFTGAPLFIPNIGSLLSRS